MFCSKKGDNSHAEMYNWLHNVESWSKDYPSLGDRKKKLSSLTPGKTDKILFLYSYPTAQENVSSGQGNAVICGLATT